MTTESETEPTLLLVQDDDPKEISVTGGLIAVIGNSGSGKSTLFRLLQSALLSGRSMADKAEEAVSPRRPTWYVGEALLESGGQPLVCTPQDNARVHPSLTAVGNILHFLHSLPWCTNHRPKVLEAALPDGDLADPAVRAQAALRVVGLEDRADLRASSLSGGEQRRLLLAMDLALGPRVLVADEPLSQLDSSSATKVFEALKKQSEEGPVLFTVHQPIDEWLERCDQVWLVERPSYVAAAISGKDFVHVADQLSVASDNTVENAPTLMDMHPNTKDMSLIDVMAAARHVQGGEGGQPAAYRILARTKDDMLRQTTLNALRAQASMHPVPQMSPVERPEVDEPASSGRWIHTISHEVKDQFLGNLRSGLYWLMLTLFIGVNFFTNFFGGADELPFSIPLATNALLVSILFVSTVSGVRVWAGAAASRIRELQVRGSSLPATLTAKAAPAFLEAVLIASLAMVGTWTLDLRGAAPGWPDAFSSVPWLAGLPTVVLLMVFVGLVGWSQGATISLLMSVYAQRGALKHFSNPQAEKKKKKESKPPAMGMDPMQQAYSLAVLLVVGQIGLGGAFGQITSTYSNIVSDAATLVVDSLGSVSPLRWGYNAALISEWRQTRCRVRDHVSEECQSSFPAPTLSNECVPGGTPDDTITPSQVGWTDINEPACGRMAPSDQNGALEPDRRHTVALYFQAAGEDADRLDRLLERQRLLEEREIILPPQAVSQAFSAQSYAELNEKRKDGFTKDLACFQREANVDYLYNLTETMVAKGMIRPELIDVAWCWRNCPDIREIKGTWQNGRLEPSGRAQYMLKDCPVPGQKTSGDAMKHFYRPVVSLLDQSTEYPCQELAHDLFVDQSRFQAELDGLCKTKVLLPAEQNLLFWMLAVALGWGGLALFLAVMWSGRVARGA